MATRLVALSEGTDIPLDRPMIMVGRHPNCDARLDSIRVSRRHCCMTLDHGEIVVRDLGSTNGIRINGQRVEMGRLRPGDELSIAHLRYRLEGAEGVHEATLADNGRDFRSRAMAPAEGSPSPPEMPVLGGVGADESPLAAAVRGLLPPSMADRCRIQVILQMDQDREAGLAAAGGPASAVREPEDAEPCPSNLSP